MASNRFAKFGTLALPMLAAASALTTSSLAQENAQAPVPISQEHHHHLVFENSYVRAYEVEVPAHESTLMHQHDHDYVYLVLGNSSVSNQVQGKAAVKLQLPDTTVNFSKGPFAHIAGNDGSSAFRNITIELLKPQGEVKIFAPSIDAALASAKPIAGSDGSREALIMDTGEVRVSAVEISGKGVWQPTAKAPRLTLNLYMLNDLIQSKIFPDFVKVGETPYGFDWVDGGIQQLRGLRDMKMKFLALEFK